MGKNNRPNHEDNQYKPTGNLQDALELITEAATPHPKDPQAELREALINMPIRIKGPKQAVYIGLDEAEVDHIIKLFQVHQQELLSDLEADKAYHRCEGGWFEYVPLEVIQSKIGGLNG